MKPYRQLHHAGKRIKSRVSDFPGRPCSKHKTLSALEQYLMTIKALQLQNAHRGSDWPNGKEIPLPTG
jgi:hypothetical protein